MQPYNIAELRRQARRRLPRMLFDFVDGGAEDESTLRRNIEVFAAMSLMPRMFRPTPDCDTSVEVLGERLALPAIVAPTGLSGLLWPHGELAAARACARIGTVLTLSHGSTCSLEQAAAATDAAKWFNVLVYKDRAVTRSLVERAAAARYHGICLTVDLQTMGQRERDIRNGFVVPPRLTPATAFDLARHPGWLWRMRATPRPTMRNYVSAGMSDLKTLAAHMATLTDANVGWSELEWVRSLWQGPLIVKGILHPDDARLAVDAGADAVVVSNHGGRQLDGAVAAAEALPAVADKVGTDAAVLVDGGVRRGSDIVKAIALGARACLIGRAHLYGLAAAGEAGVVTALEILRAEMRRAMALGGLNRVDQIDGRILHRA